MHYTRCRGHSYPLTTLGSETTAKRHIDSSPAVELCFFDGSSCLSDLKLQRNGNSDYLTRFAVKVFNFRPRCCSAY